MDALIADLRFAIRTLRRSPGFSLVVVATLGLGIGVTTSIFSVVDGVLLRPLQYVQPERLVQIWDATGRFGLTEPEYVWLSEHPGPLESLSVYSHQQADITGADADPERVPVARVTSTFLPTLGVPPRLGRGFRPTDTEPGSELVTLLTHSLWQRRFGGEADLVGQSITLNGQPARVIGILPAEFRFPGADVSLLLPYPLDPASLNTSDRFLHAIARLAPETTPGRAASLLGDENRRYLRGAEARFGRFNSTEFFRVVPLSDQLLGGVESALWLLLGAAAFVLLVACANIAGMWLARGETRTREFAMREALGAGRGRVMRQLVTESVVLGIVGGAAGVLLALGGNGLLTYLAGADVPRFEGVSIDLRALAFASLVTIAAGVLVALLPAIRLTAGGLIERLRSRSASAPATLFRRILVGGEVALAVTLVVGAGLCARSLSKLANTDPGFRAAGVLTFQVSPPLARYADTASVMSFFRTSLERLGQLPGVTAAGAVSRLPLSESNPNSSFEIEGRVREEDETQIADYRLVTPEYFEALAIESLEGRAFERSDDGSGIPVAVISRTMAEVYWLDASPVGARIRVRDDLPWITVVGVVEDVRQVDLRASPRATMYFAHGQAWAVQGLGPLRTMSMTLRTNVPAPSLIGPVRRVLADIDPLLPLANVRTMEDVTAGSLSDLRFSTALLGGFSAFAVLLGLIGVYGILAYLVARRTREIGVRQAIGARKAHVLRLILGEGLRVTLTGLVAGIAMSLMLTRVLGRLLYQVSPIDPTIYFGVVVVVLSMAGLACWIPARRATRVEPLSALRQE